MTTWPLAFNPPPPILPSDPLQLLKETKGRVHLTESKTKKQNKEEEKSDKESDRMSQNWTPKKM